MPERTEISRRPRLQTNSSPTSTLSKTPSLMDRIARWFRPQPRDLIASPNDSLYIQPYVTEAGESIGALVAINGPTKDIILKKFQDRYKVEGDHVREGGAMSPASMLTLIGGASGALGLSSATSGTLFMATASPATLMPLGAGFGSAVIGTGGRIVAQAPFIPMAGALMPAVAPLIAFQAITTIVIMNQFQKVHERLNRIERTINRLLQRSEATFIGEIISATSRLDDIEEHFSAVNRFTPEMLIRLTLVEDKVNPIFERYHFLYRTQGIERGASIEDLKFKHNDAYLAVILSILDLRIDLLRLKVAIQDSPGAMRLSAERLKNKAAHYERLWADISKNPDQIAEVAAELRASVEEMSWLQRDITQRWRRKDISNRATQMEEHRIKIDGEGVEHIELAQKFSSSLTAPLEQMAPMSLFYWRDEYGEHSYYTSDLEFSVESQKIKS
ncbi:hypothetical protein NB709_001105 [Xanthomonas sacchari]|nr:hypothetical protein [Xanthomonas sacchari]